MIPGIGRAELQRIGQIRFEPRFRFGLYRLVDDRRLTAHAVQFKGDNPIPIFIWRADIDQLDEQCFAFLNADGNFLAGFKAIEKRGCGQDRNVAKIAAEFGKFRVNIRGTSNGCKDRHRRSRASAGCQLIARLFEIERRHGCAGTAFERFALSEHDTLELFGPATERLAESAGKHVDDDSWNGVLLAQDSARPPV